MNAVVVHCLAHCTAALSAALRTGSTVTLLSPPEAAASLGIDYFNAMLATAGERVPGASFEAVLDCGDAPGLALAALAAGVSVIRLSAGEETLRRLDSIAESLGARVLREWPAEPLDLADSKDPLSAALAYLTTR